MVRHKKRKSRRTDKTVDDEDRSDDVDVDADPVVAESKAQVSVRSNLIACALIVVTVVIVSFVFAPWFERYMAGQFFGLSGDYGTDFFRYSQGSMALTQPGIDPYSDDQMFQALEDGRLGTDHPNLYYDAQTSIKAFAETPEPIAKGVVSPPFLLVLLAPFVHLCGFTLALNTWTVASLLGISWLSVKFWQRLIPPAPRWQQFASHGAMLSLLVLSSFPVLWSVIYGQFEAIYFLAIGGAIYLWVFKQDSPATPLLVGLLLAIGGAIKLFPLLLLGYFVWRVILAVRSSSEPTSTRSLVAMREVKVILSGIGFFVAINALTGVVFGFDLYVSFLGKLADLQVEGTGPSMKGNLLSFVNFVPVWLFGPFSRMHGGASFAYLLIALGVAVVIAKSIHRNVAAEPFGREDQMRGLLEMTLILAALPTLLPHWWIYYNVILILPLMVCFVAATETIDPRARRWIMTLTVLSGVLTFSYLTTSVFFGAFPNVSDFLVNRSAVDAAIAKLASEPTLMANLPYSSAFGEPYVAELEGRVVSLFNLLYGYPGTVMLFVANWLALRSPRSARGTSHQTFGTSWWLKASTLRVKGPIVVASGVLLSLSGGYAIVWEGTRQLSLVPQVEFLTDEHAIEDTDLYLDQLLDRIRQNTRGRPRREAAGLVFDLVPPNHFIEEAATSDRALADALLRQDQSYFEDPRAVDQLLALFASYQANLNSQYPSWFGNGESPDLPSWRYHGQPGGLLEGLERKFRQESIPLRRMEQVWIEWQAQFRYEVTWQQALETLGQGDIEGYKRFVIAIFAHHDAISHQQGLLNDRLAELHVALSQSAAAAAPGRPGFVYVQEPVYMALSTFTLCHDLDSNAPLEAGVGIGTLYVVEEVLRRARLAKTGSPHEALTFAQKTVSQISNPHIVAWWSQRASLGPEEILRSLSQDGLIEMNQVEAEGLLIWDQLPQDQRGP